jgi:hypothetical protein
VQQNQTRGKARGQQQERHLKIELIAGHAGSIDLAETIFTFAVAQQRLVSHAPVQMYNVTTF